MNQLRKGTAREDDGVTVRSFAAAIWRRRWLALAVLVVELAAVATWLATAPRSYTAAATITATPSQQLLSSTGNFDNLETTLAEIANSRSVLQDVVPRLSQRRSIATLRNEVRGTRVTGTILIRITVTDADPRAAAQIANVVAMVLPLHEPSAGSFSFTQTDSAHRPTTYSSPDTKLIVLAGAALGLLLALSVALIRDRAARTVETEDELRECTGVDVLAVVPQAKDLASLPATEPNAPQSAAFRSLRVELEFVSSAKPIGTIVLASVAADSQASSWLATNLAVALAQVNHHVLLIDGNFRDRQTHPALTGSDSPGLYGVLRDEVGLEDAVRPGPVDGVTVLPAGDAVTASTANLIELRFHKVLAEVDHRFDVVIVLAPSAVSSDDARIMAIGGSMLLAVPSRGVRPDTLHRLLGEFANRRIRVLGSVLIRSGRTFGA